MATAIPSTIQMAEDVALGAARDAVGQERFNELRGQIPSWVPHPDLLACATQAGRDASLALGYDCNHWNNFSGDVPDVPDPDTSGGTDRVASGGADPAADPWLVDPALLDLPLPLNASDAYAARFNAAKDARDAARAQAAQAEAIAAAAAAAAEAALRAGGPGANQGNPQPIPNVGGNPVQEIEPQRVYNEDHTNLPSYMQMPTNQNELNYDGKRSSSLPIVTIGTVAIGGVLIFLWNSRRE